MQLFKNVSWLVGLMHRNKRLFWVTGEVVGGLADVRHPGVEMSFWVLKLQVLTAT